MQKLSTIAAYRPNASLIGVRGSRSQLETPALILDLDALEHNIWRMSDLCVSKGIALRPHVKTHKSSRIAALQIQAGAVGVCAATVREARVMVAAGIGDVLLTTPLIGEVRTRELLALLDHSANVSVVVDSALGLRCLQRHVSGTGRSLEVFVDVDLQAMYRTGVSDSDSALELAQAIAASSDLEFGGLQFYSGIVQHISDAVARAEFYGRQIAKLQELIEVLANHGLQPPVVSGGGTGTFAIDADYGIITENQAGSYAVMDVEYGDIEVLSDEANPFRSALFVQSTVISNNAKGLVTIDAGSKSLATDGATPRIASGAPEGAVYQQFGDEFGVLICPGAIEPEALATVRRSQSEQDEPGHLLFYKIFGNLNGEAGQLDIGAKVELTAAHCDPTINLFNHYHCVRGDTLVDIWPVDARGNL